MDRSVPAEKLSKRPGLNRAHDTGETTAQMGMNGMLGMFLGSTNNSGGEYRGSNMPATTQTTSEHKTTKVLQLFSSTKDIPKHWR